jgi:hypothetical protein
MTLNPDDAQLLLTDLPQDVLIQCLPRKYGPAVPATCRLLRDLSKLAARQFSITCDPRIRNMPSRRAAIPIGTPATSTSSAPSRSSAS